MTTPNPIIHYIGDPAGRNYVLPTASQLNIEIFRADLDFYVREPDNSPIARIIRLAVCNARALIAQPFVQFKYAEVMQLAHFYEGRGNDPDHNAQTYVAQARQFLMFEKWPGIVIDTASRKVERIAHTNRVPDNKFIYLSGIWLQEAAMAEDAHKYKHMFQVTTTILHELAHVIMTKTHGAIGLWTCNESWHATPLALNPTQRVQQLLETNRLLLLANMPLLPALYYGEAGFMFEDSLYGGMLNMHFDVNMRDSSGIPVPIGAFYLYCTDTKYYRIDDRYVRRIASSCLDDGAVAPGSLSIRRIFPFRLLPDNVFTDLTFISPSVRLIDFYRFPTPPLIDLNNHAAVMAASVRPEDYFVPQIEADLCYPMTIPGDPERIQYTRPYLARSRIGHLL